MDEDVFGFPYIESTIIGLIWNPKVINQSVTFLALIVRGSIPCGCGGHGIPYTSVFKQFTIPKYYTGYIGRFFISVSYVGW